MRDGLVALGWFEIETIDDDLGRSVAGSMARASVERMVAEGGPGKVGRVIDTGSEELLTAPIYLPLLLNSESPRPIGCSHQC
jgi:hypothetical protein